jgi:hypothetical protein
MYWDLLTGRGDRQGKWSPMQELADQSNLDPRSLESRKYKQAHRRELTQEAIWPNTDALPFPSHLNKKGKVEGQSLVYNQRSLSFRDAFIALFTVEPRPGTGAVVSDLRRGYVAHCSDREDRDGQPDCGSTGDTPEPDLMAQSSRASPATPRASPATPRASPATPGKLRFSTMTSPRRLDLDELHETPGTPGIIKNHHSTGSTAPVLRFVNTMQPNIVDGHILSSDHIVFVLPDFAGSEDRMHTDELSRWDGTASRTKKVHVNYQVDFGGNLLVRCTCKMFAAVNTMPSLLSAGECDVPTVQYCVHCLVACNIVSSTLNAQSDVERTEALQKYPALARFVLFCSVARFALFCSFN